VQSEIGDLYHVSYRRLVAQVYAFTTDLTEAQDAVQEAFARALARRGQLGDVDAPEAWLRTVAVNIVRRRWRRRQLLNTILLRERPLTKMLEDAPEPDRADLREALATLPRAYREVIVLHYLADLPVDEVAAILEVPVGTVKSRLSRGREALKGLLDDVEAPPLDAVRQRANRIRTNRRVAQTSAALAVVFASAIGFFALQPTSLPPVSPTPAPSISVQTFSGSGITIRSVHDPASVPDLPGEIVELGIDGENILRTSLDVYAKSDDGGEHWEILPGYQRRDLPPWGGETWPEALKNRSRVFPRATAEGVWWAQIATADGKMAFAFSATPHDNASWKTRPMDIPAGEASAAVVGDKVIAIVGTKLYFVTETGVEVMSDNPNMPVPRGEPIMLPGGRLMIAAGESQWFFTEDMGHTWTTADTRLGTIGWLYAIPEGYAAIDYLRAGWALVSSDGLVWNKLPIR
jgi:RNA polymerase sigma-70 factor (sigma-E family)